MEDVRTHISELFALKMKQQEMGAAMIERELKEIHSLIEKRKKNREQIIERKLRELTGQEDELGW
jgi:hypothetical protein